MTASQSVFGACFLTVRYGIGMAGWIVEMYDRTSEKARATAAAATF